MGSFICCGVFLYVGFYLQFLSFFVNDIITFRGVVIVFFVLTSKEI